MALNRENFGSRFGVLMALAGSAIGLGNMWRFPYLTAKNGGAAFILIYFALLLTASLPIMITEYLLGRRSRSNVVSSFARLGHPKLKILGIPSVITAVFIMGFYCVVGGWATKYLYNAVLFQYHSTAADYGQLFNSFVTSPAMPLIYTFVFLALTALITMGGIRKGIERFSKVMMTALFVIIILMAIHTLTLPGAMEGVRYLLVPDFSKVTSDTVLDALGQSLFTLGLGAGTIFIYGSYVEKEEDLTISAFTASLLDTIFAIVAGLAIIPALFAIAAMNGTEPNIDAGPSLAFITLPSIFASMPMGDIIAILFFLALVLAAVTSSVSMFESLAAFFIETTGLKRNGAIIVSFLTVFIPGIFCSLSQGVLSDFKICGYNVFDFFDHLSSNYLMTTSGLLLLIFTGWIMDKKDVMDELSGGGRAKVSTGIMNLVYVLIKYVAPLGLAVIFLNALFT